MRDIAIVGGGPSGSICAERLAGAGFNVTLFDEHLAWEKPCGGGLTHKAIEAYPFLLKGPHPKKLIYTVELINSGGHRALLPMGWAVGIYWCAVLKELTPVGGGGTGCALK